jgi:flagellar biosynthetic protein FliS
MSHRSAAVYRRVFVESAPPARLLDELMARLVRDLGEAADAAQRNDPRARGAAAGHALAIVGELVAALDPRAAPELCQELSRLYDFALVEITQAGAHNDAAALRRIAAIFAELGSAFRTAAETP